MTRASICPLLLLSALLLAGCATTAPRPAAFPEVGIDGDWLTVGGEKFLVVGVGYEPGSRPGRVPWKYAFEPDVMREDFRRIRAAGFNTIRSWGPLSDDELNLAAEYGLWVIQGLWIKPDADFNDAGYRQKTYDYIEREVTRSAKHPNVLFYLLLNEPHGDAVYRAGPNRMNEFYTEMVKVAKRCDPKRLFSYSNCVSTDFMVPTMWDLAAQNIYPYSPTTIEKALGYRAYVEWVKRSLAPTKPLVVTEYGLSVSPNGDGRGYGGNTTQEQRDGVIRMTEDWLAAGAAGGCVFMWTDGWWKSGNENVHDGGAEEWYGLLQEDSGYLGSPRPVYFALQEYNKAIRTLPRDGQRVGGSFNIEVLAPDAARVQYSIDESPWTDLPKGMAGWWRDQVMLMHVAEGSHRIWTREIDASGFPGSEKLATVQVENTGRLNEDLIAVHFVGLPEKMSCDDGLNVVVQVTDRDGKPLAGRKVRIDRFLNTGWDERGAEVETDAAGRAATSFSAMHVPGIISIAAGTVYTDGMTRKTYGDYRHVELVEKR